MDMNTKRTEMNATIVRLNNNFICRPKTAIGPDGNEYSSRIALCNAYGILVPVLEIRKKRGMPDRAALRNDVTSANEVFGPENIIYNSIEHMCQLHGVDKADYIVRVQQLGYNVAEALELEGRGLALKLKREQDMSLHIEKKAETTEKEVVVIEKEERANKVILCNCEHCGQPILTGSLFCGECGKTQSKVAEQRQNVANATELLEYEQVIIKKIKEFISTTGNTNEISGENISWLLSKRKKEMKELEKAKKN